MRRIVLLLASMALVVLVAGSVALAAQITCSSDPCFGTSGDDHIVGTNAAEEIRARAGTDIIDGLDGDDTLRGQKGNDVRIAIGMPYDDRVIAGGNGDDTSFGGAGNDWLSDLDYSGLNGCTGEVVGSQLKSCTGRDTQHGGPGEDFLAGYSEGDALYGNAGRDSMLGYSGPDTMRGGADADSIAGDDGDDYLLGGRGDDYIDALISDAEYDPGARDIVDCGEGFDVGRANENDEVRGNCENVIRVPNRTASSSGVQGSAGSSNSAHADLEKAREEFLAKNTP